MKYFIEEAVSWRDEDIEYVRLERKFWALRDQNLDLDKADRKEAQKWIKACGIVLEFMTGYTGGKMVTDKKGREPVPCGVPDFPVELRDRIRYLLVQAASDHQIYAEFF